MGFFYIRGYMRLTQPYIIFYNYSKENHREMCKRLNKPVYVNNSNLTYLYCTEQLYVSIAWSEGSRREKEMLLS